MLIMLFRVVWLLSLALGVWIWSGRGYATLSVHVALGFLLVLLLAVLCVLGVMARVRLGQVLLAALWVVLLPVVGFGQLSWMAGSEHWMVRVLHLVIGLAAIGSAEMLAARAKVAAIRAEAS